MAPPRRGTLAATYPPVTAACGPATSTRGTGRVPGGGVVGRHSAEYCSFTSPSCRTRLSTTFSLGPALWWRASATAAATDWRSCRSHARSRRCRRLAAAPVAPSTSMEVNS